MSRAGKHSSNTRQDALVALQQGRADEALRLLDQICRETPGDAEAWCLLGAARGMQGQHVEAVQACWQALTLRPDYPEAWCNLGASLADLGRHDEAVHAYREALRRRPHYPGALYNLGNVLKAQQRLDEAIAAYREALALQPGFARAWCNLGVALAERAEYTAALECSERALRIEPAYPEAHNNRGIALAALGRSAEAAAAYRAALALRPGYAEAHTNLGAVLNDAGAASAALEHSREACRLAPNLADAWNNLGNALKATGDVAGALAAYREALHREPHHRSAHSNLLFALNCDVTATPAAVFDAHRRWGTTLSSAAPAATHANVPQPERRLRIGYVSPDFRAHAAAYFIEPLLMAHDREHFEIFCYAQLPRPDAVSEHLQGLATHWRRIEGLGDAQLAELIRADGIDVLIDLAGHTADNRLAALALRPAPVQVSFLGYPNTTGSPAIGYYITDAYLDPPGEADARYTERLVRLPLFCCYRPPAAPDPAPPPVTGNGYVTFGSFSSLAKLNERVVALWARVLRALPTARLLLQSAALADEQTGTAWRARFAAHDVSGDRLELAGHLPLDDYLRAHGRVDIALDPFPWSGHTTTCHALWMGVPAVTLAASTHAARMTADILRVIGLEELVAATEDEYVALAVALASDRTRLAQLRRDLRRRMSHSPLCDAAGFTRELEQAYRRLWRAWCATAR